MVANFELVANGQKKWITEPTPTVKPVPANLPNGVKFGALTRKIDRVERRWLRLF